MFSVLILFIFLLLKTVSTNLSISNVVTAPLCYMSAVADPLSPGNFGNAEIQRIAWPLSTMPFTVPITINGQAPVGVPEVICMTGCPAPPCLPIYQCPPGDLWWSITFPSGSLIVSPNDLLRLPDALAPPPPVLAFLWNTYVPLSTLVPTAITTPTAVMSPTPFIIVNQVVPSATPSVSPSLSPSASFPSPCIAKAVGAGPTVAYIFVGILGLTVLLLVYCIIMLYRYSHCPYCQIVLRVGNPLLTHLKECPEHLKQFTPLTPVITITEPPSAPVTQLVFARSSHLVRPIVASVEKESLGLVYADSNEVDVVLESTPMGVDAKNAAPN